jgi:peptide/nickel transport system substrate-binding protein
LPEGLGSKVHFTDADKPQLTLPYGYFYHIQNWWVDTK